MQKKSQYKFLLILESFIYSSGQMLLGLFLHPYRSMQILVKNKVLLPFIFYPVFFVLLLYFSLHINLLASIYHNIFIFKFFYQVGLFFCFYWQIALFYLWIRFTRAFAKSSHS